MIAISGDLADGFVRNLEKAAYPLMNLTSKYGIYFVTGKEYICLKEREFFYCFVKFFFQRRIRKDSFIMLLYHYLKAEE